MTRDFVWEYVSLRDVAHTFAHHDWRSWILLAANQLFIALLCFQPHLGLRGLWGKRQVTYDVRWLTRSSQKHYRYLKDLCSIVVSLKGHFIAQAPLHLHRRIPGLCHMLNIYLGCLVWKQLACCPFKCSLQSDLNIKDVLHGHACTWDWLYHSV